MIELPATISKQDIAVCKSMVGSINGESMLVDGVEYDAKTLVFKGFAGSINLSTGQYDGILKFELCNLQEEDAPIFSGFPQSVMQGEEGEVHE